VTGLLCGPYVFNLLSRTVVSDLRILDDLALGLIALTAGGELKFAALKKGWKSICYITSFQALVVFTGTGSCVLLARQLVPFLAEADWSVTIAVALCFGVIAVASSPASTIAIITETKAQGPMTDRILGVTVIKDVVVIIAFAIVLFVAKWLAREEGRVDTGSLLTVFAEMAFSLLMGATLGVLTALYIKYVNAEMLLFVVGMVFVGTAFVHWLEFEPILMFISAGFVVENGSKQGKNLIRAIGHASLPVYVVFFALAGAAIDLRVLHLTWIVASILVIGRLATIFFGTYLGSRLAEDPPEVRRYAWMGFLTQAGISLGLATIVENSFPAWGPPFRTLIVATIAVNQMIGPVAFKLSLDRAGESEEMRSRQILVETSV